MVSPSLWKRLRSSPTKSGLAVEAFLRAPLYAKLYEEYQGYQLPQAAAIQRKMELLGLPKKQVERARQVFAVSVEAAGFINSNGRFVKPVVAARSDAERPHNNNIRDDTPPPETQEDTKGRKGGGGDGGGKDHPLIDGLLVTLPTPGAEWPSEGRAAWLKMAASIFDMIYKNPATADNRKPIDIDKLIGSEEDGG